ncbi:MAG: hypothetical protein K6F65_02600 [Lachnospiraceae bacterium]|nr:hypothetical protein [Lachnospiraceae bacterium]
MDREKVYKFIMCAFPALLIIAVVCSVAFSHGMVSDAEEGNIISEEEQKESRLTELPEDAAPAVDEDSSPDSTEHINNIATPGVMSATDYENAVAEADAWIKEHGIYVLSEYVDISHNDISDVDIDMIISRFPNVNRLIMIDCGLDNAGYAALQDRHPDIKIVWEIVLSHWTIRTDVVAFSTFKTTAEEFYLQNDEAYYLKYCNELVALDLGHNYVSDLSFLEYMPDLKVLILVDNVKEKDGETLRHLTDLSELKYVPKLRYLEIFANNVSDLSFLDYMPDLEDLNISYNSVSSIEHMKNMPKIKKLWMEHTYISGAGVSTLRQLYPNARIVSSGEGSVDQGWRSGERYRAVRRMFFENVIEDHYRD